MEALMGFIDAALYVLGFAMVVSMALRSVTLVTETRVFYGLLCARLDSFNAAYVTTRYMTLPSLLASPGWVMVAGMTMFELTPYDELVAMVEEVMEQIE